MADISDIGQYVLGLLERKDRRRDKDLDRELKVLELNANIQERQKDREWNRESQMIEHYQDLSESLNQQLRDTEDSLISAGLTIDDLNGVKPAENSGNAISIVNQITESNSEALNTIIQSLDSIKAPLKNKKTRLAHYNAGKNLFNKLDVDDDGTVNSGEINKYFEENPIEAQYQDEFLAGVNNSQPSALQKNQLNMSSVQINNELNKLAKGDLDLEYWENALKNKENHDTLTTEIMDAQLKAQLAGNDEASIKLEFLRSSLENKEALEGLTIEMQEINNKQQQIELDYLPDFKELGIKKEELSLVLGADTHAQNIQKIEMAKEEIEQSKIKTSLDEATLAAVEDNVAIDNLQGAKKIAESGLVSNLTNQNEAGANLAQLLSITAERDSYGKFKQYSLSSLEALFVSDPNEFDKIINKIGSVSVDGVKGPGYHEIKDMYKYQVRDLITAITFAKADESLGNYNSFIDKLSDLKVMNDRYLKIKETAEWKEAEKAVLNSDPGWMSFQDPSEYNSRMLDAAVAQLYFKGKNDADYTEFRLASLWDQGYNNMFGDKVNSELMQHAVTLNEQEDYYKLHIDSLEELLMGQNVGNLEKWDYQSDPNIPSATKNALAKIFGSPI